MSQSNLITDGIGAVLREGSRAVLVTLAEGSKILIRESEDRIGTLGNSELDELAARQAPAFLSSRDQAALIELQKSAALFERIEAEPQLVICGAGHVGAALARIASVVGYQVSLVDDRAEFLNRELFSSPTEQGIKLVPATSWSESLREAIGNGKGVSVAIVTRGHKQDEDCLRAVIAVSPDYIGMIGSKRRTNIVLDKLREEGTSDELLRKVHAPIGLDIAAVSPEEVALAILAEIVAERRGGSGGPLSNWRRA